MASQAASAIERELLGEQARQAQLLEETDTLQQALLNSIAHNIYDHSKLCPVVDHEVRFERRTNKGSYDGECHGACTVLIDHIRALKIQLGDVAVWACRRGCVSTISRVREHRNRRLIRVRLLWIHARGRDSGSFHDAQLSTVRLAT